MINAGNMFADNVAKRFQAYADSQAPDGDAVATYADGGRWITLSGSDGKGTTHVKIGDGGKITAGPPALEGKAISKVDSGKSDEERKAIASKSAPAPAKPKTENMRARIESYVGEMREHLKTSSMSDEAKAKVAERLAFIERKAAHEGVDMKLLEHQLERAVADVVAGEAAVPAAAPAQPAGADTHDSLIHEAVRANAALKDSHLPDELKLDVAKRLAWVDKQARWAKSSGGGYDPAALREVMDRAKSLMSTTVGDRVGTPVAAAQAPRKVTPGRRNAVVGRRLRQRTKSARGRRGRAAIQRAGFSDDVAVNFRADMGEVFGRALYADDDCHWRTIGASKSTNHKDAILKHLSENDGDVRGVKLSNFVSTWQMEMQNLEKRGLVVRSLKDKRSFKWDIVEPTTDDKTAKFADGVGGRFARYCDESTRG